MRHCVLYFTLGCHLCELAEEELSAWGSLAKLQLERQDIADSAALVERYGVRIPVLRDMITGRELDWPFEQYQLDSFFDVLA